MRKTLLFIAYLLGFTCAIEAQQLKIPAPSSTQTIKQDFGLGSIELSYSRPNIKGRKVFGDLVPFGKVWRTGANQATTLTFTDEVIIGGTKIPAGKYGLLTMPDKNAWTIIITKQLDVTSPAAYKQESDVVRVQAKPQGLKNKVETFTMQFDNVKPTSIELHMLWDQTDVVLPITAEIEGKVMAQIDELMKKEDKKSHPYFPAAMYYMENGKDLNQALDWFTKAAEQNPKAFWVLHQRANCLAKLGKKQEAIESANKSIELAKEAKNDDYIALNQKLLATLKK
jgi:hypothetical protein